MATNPDINLPINLKRFTAPNALTTVQPDGGQLVSLDENGLLFVTGGDVGAVLKSVGIPKAAFQLATSNLQAGIVPQTLTMAYASMHLVAGMTVNLDYNFGSADANYNDFAFAVLVDANDFTSFQPLLLADQKHFQQLFGGLTDDTARLFAVLQGYHAGQHATVDHTGDYRLLVGVADVGDKTGVSALKLETVSLGLPGGSYSVTTTGDVGLKLSDGSLLDLIGQQENADGTAAFGQTLNSDDPLAGTLIGDAGQAVISSDFVNTLNQQLLDQRTAAGGLLATQNGGAINPQAGGLATLTPTTTVPGVGMVPTNSAALTQLDGGNAALVSAAPVISNDGGSLISQDGGGLISQDGGGLISHNGLGLIDRSTGKVISNDGGTVISNDGGSVISNDGGTLAATRGTATFVLNGGASARAFASSGNVASGTAFATLPVTRSYTLTSDPGVAPAAPPTALGEVLVSPASGTNKAYASPAIAGLSDGRTVVVWSDNIYNTDSAGQVYDSGMVEVRGQLYNADGSQSGGVFDVNGFFKDSRLNLPAPQPGVTGLADGRFVVIFTAPGYNTNADVKAQFYNADGTVNGGLVRVDPASFTDPSSVGRYSQGIVASLSGGGAVVVYRGPGGSGAPFGAQRYAADGTAQGGIIAVGPASPRSEEYPAAVGLQDGGFVVAYAELQSNGANSTGIFMQRFSATGASAGVPVRVNTTTSGPLVLPAITTLTDGTFVVAYKTANNTSGMATIFAQRFGAAGVPIGGEVTITTEASVLLEAPAISALHDGTYAVVWAASSLNLEGQLMSADGIKQGLVFSANPPSPSHTFTAPAATTTGSGALEVVGIRDTGSVPSDIRSETFAIPAAPTSTAPTTYGRVLDGLVKGATVFADANGNGKLDPGEATATTDAKGRFTFTTRASGPVVATGGTDVSTGLPFTGTYTAPAGSLSVTALSTLVQKVMVARGSSVGEALLRVTGALGLSLKTDLTSFNPITATLNGVVDAGKALVADAVVTNTLALAKAAGATGDLFGKLASQIAAASYGTVDLTAVATLQGLGLSSPTASDVSTFAKAGADLLAAKLASGESALTLVHDVTGTNKVLQGAAAPDLALGEAAGFIGAAVTKFTGDNLAAQVGAASAAANGTPFGIAYTDVTTSGLGYINGDTYTGPVAGLQRQYIWPSTDKVAIVASSPNVFLHGGIGDDALSVTSGTNVMDGGLGSNFLTGGTGADGGMDTFFVDGRSGGVTWSTINGFHHGDAVTVWGFTGASTGFSAATGKGAFSLDGVQGYQGATIHSELGGAGTGVNASFTLAGMSVADAQAKLTLSTGTVQGNTYLYVAYTG